MSFRTHPIFVLGLVFAMTSGVGAARELAGIDVPESVRLERDDRVLELVGAHVRTYLLRRITLFALYATERPPNFAALVASRAPKRVVVTILLPEFTAERFREGWRDQFAAVLSEVERRELAPQIAEFIDTLETLRRGEQLMFDFVPGEGVQFWIRGERKRTIAGEAFAVAVLGVWLGPRAVDPDLRRALLGEPL